MPTFEELARTFLPSVTWEPSGAINSPVIERGSDNIPRSVPLPSKAQMKSLSLGQMYDLSSSYGYIDTPENRVQAADAYLRGFGYDPSDKARWNRAMARLRENMRPAMLGTSRRMATRHETLRAVDGNLSQEMIYINEADEPCEECDPLGGMIKTYAEFIDDGDLPSDRCLGGSNCLCTLMRVGR